MGNNNAQVSGLYSLMSHLIYQPISFSAFNVQHFPFLFPLLLFLSLVKLFAQLRSHMAIQGSTPVALDTSALSKMLLSLALKLATSFKILMLERIYSLYSVSYIKHKPWSYYFDFLVLGFGKYEI
jgi:hypothetical protein